MRSGWRRAGSPIAASFVAILLRSLTLLALVELTGVGALQRSFGDVRLVWVGLVAVAEVTTMPAYALIYRSVALLPPPIRLDRRSAVLMVLAGFGPLARSGGFSHDRRVMQAIEGDRHSARVRVGAVAALECTALALLTAGASVIVLASAEPVSRALTWPWVIGVALGIGMAAWITGPRRMARLSQRSGRWSASLARLLRGAGGLRTLVRHPRRYIEAWAGAALYWSAEIFAFYSALRATDLRLGPSVVVLAYANGYLASRRSLPLGGAGVAELLLVASLRQLHVPLAQAVAPVIVYRAFNFVVGVAPALVADHILRTTPSAIDRDASSGRP